MRSWSATNSTRSRMSTSAPLAEEVEQGAELETGRHDTEDDRRPDVAARLPVIFLRHGAIFPGRSMPIRLARESRYVELFRASGMPSLARPHPLPLACHAARHASVPRVSREDHACRTCRTRRKRLGLRRRHGARAVRLCRPAGGRDAAFGRLGVGECGSRAFVRDPDRWTSLLLGFQCQRAARRGSGARQVWTTVQ